MLGPLRWAHRSLNTEHVLSFQGYFASQMQWKTYYIALPGLPVILPISGQKLARAGTLFHTSVRTDVSRESSPAPLRKQVWL